MVRAAAVEAEIDSEPDYLDVDVVERTRAHYRWAQSANEAVEEPEEADGAGGLKPTSCHWISPRHAEADEPEGEYEPEPDGTDDEYEYVADSSGLEAPSDTDLQLAESMSAARKRRHESKTADGQAPASTSSASGC